MVYMVLEELSTSELLEAYTKAKELKLSDDFVDILKEALEERLYTPVN
ncbi:sporulation histidine kinase inhibitor Sda [Alteribacillus sp. HJP-4]